MIIVGLTGSIAMGKSFVTRQFALNKVRTFNSDEEIAKLIENDTSLISEIKNYFPNVVVENSVDRSKLGDVVFADQKNLNKLESIIYPRYEQQMKDFIKRAEYTKQKLIVIDIPLLFEKNYQDWVDYVITVSTPKFLQIKRALKRKNINSRKLTLILQNQMKDIKKRANADYIIYTGLGRAYSFKQVATFIQMVLNERNSTRYGNNRYKYRRRSSHC